MKAVNHATANEFHVWQRNRLPHSVVVQDLDAWGLLIADGDYQPTALIELKRSSMAPENWRPFHVDRPNYASLLHLARRADLPLFVVYFRKGEPIEDDSIFHVFQLTEAMPEYHGQRQLMAASTFAARFPFLFDTDTRGRSNDQFQLDLH